MHDWSIPSDGNEPRTLTAVYADAVQEVIDELAKAAGVAIATLYRYFPSKAHLFTAVMRWQVEHCRLLMRALPLMIKWLRKQFQIK